MRIVKNVDGVDKVIQNVNDWRRLAPPTKGDGHWQDGCSAKELAKAWCPHFGAPGVPGEIALALASRSEFASLRIDEATPEHCITFDSFSRGTLGTRHADLVCYGFLPDESCVAVNVEAKAIEAYGDTVAKTLTGAVARTSNTKFPARLKGLQLALLPSVSENQLGNLRYQLLSATAGTLVYAKENNADFAVFLVHEFLTALKRINPQVKENSKALDDFVFCLSGGAINEVPLGGIVGPILVPGGGIIPGDIPLYIGKARRLLP